MLTVKYNAKNFFGDIEYREDTKNNPTLTDIKKAMQFLKKSHDNAIEIDNTVLFWDSMMNFEYGVLTAREYTGNSYNEFLWNYDGCKTNYYRIYKGTN